MTKRHEIIAVLVEAILEDDIFQEKIQKIIDKKLKNKQKPDYDNSKRDLDFTAPNYGNNIDNEPEQNDNKLDREEFINSFNLAMSSFGVYLDGDDDMSSIIEKLKRFFTAKENTISEQSNKINDLNASCAQAKQTNIEYQQQIQSLKNDYNQICASNQDYQNRIQDLKERYRQAQQQNNDYKDQVNKLNNICNQINEENRRYEREVNKLNQEQNDLLQTNSKLKHDLSDINNKMSEILVIDELFAKYKECTKLRESLKGMVMDSDILAFIASFSSLSDLDNIWDFVNNNKNKLDNNEVNLLAQIFTVFIEFQNKKFQDRKYSILQANIGDNFMPTQQISTSLNTSGKVTENYFPGYGTVEVDNGEYVIKRIKKQAMVKIA